ncbi:hypothetical protein GQ53DRAFT_872073 [Thozetella sp. PMI_491]|nr:hypothetical protein GQ53DRAFT_872073 [Thozetella sp. PMI_491]
MKFLTTVVPFALSLAVASPLESRAVTEFDVTNFSASCAGDNSGCQWSFNLVEVGFSSAVLTCTGSTTSGTSFPNGSGPFQCSDTSVVFTFTKILTRYRMVITDVHTPGSSVAGSKIWDGTDFPTVTDATGTHQAYTGATSFNIAAS